MQPVALKVRDSGRELLLEWPDGSRKLVEAIRLWIDCPSSRGRRRRMDGAAPTPIGDIRITAVDLVGLYGVNIAFSDGHDRGIYPWGFLANLSEQDAGASAESSAA